MGKTIEKAILGVLLVLVLGIGSLLVTAAVTNKNPLDYISSIRVADSGDDNVPEVSEAQESAHLAPLAKITTEEAKIIAMGSLTGEVTEVELDNENGNVVYSVEIMDNNVKKDVKIDAGNGKVLKIESDDDEAEIEDGPENELEEDEKEGSGFEDDGIEHEFEGDHED